MQYHFLLSAFVFSLLSTNVSHARMADEQLFLARAAAKNKYERTRITQVGIAIDGIFSDSVTFIASREEIKKLRAARIPLEVTPLPKRERDFPATDHTFHNYAEMVKALDDIAQKFPQLAERFDIGKSIEGRKLEGIRLSTNKNKDSLPTAIFMGCHHAREHVSVEVPLKLAEYLAENHAKDPRIQNLLANREVWIVPMVNPDGAEHDVSNGSYQYWRKNRRNNGDGTFGVDLNRNYGPKEFFNGPGSSGSTNSDIYRGKHEFSEPETLAVRDFVRERKKATMLLTYHTFSELILWPYGHTYSDVSNPSDLKVFQTMAKKMAEWNHYTPEKSSDLYLSSGDTADWAYYELKLFAFTFELSPNSFLQGGFYPGAAAVDPIFKANVEPALYLIEHAENPYRVLEQGPSDPLHLRR